MPLDGCSANESPPKKWGRARWLGIVAPFILVIALTSASVGTTQLTGLGQAHPLKVERAPGRYERLASERSRIPYSSPQSRSATTTAAVTGTITPGGPPVTVTISTPGDTANLTFPGNAGQRVSLQATNSTIGSWSP